MYSYHLFLISSASFKYFLFLSFIMPIFAWNVLLVSPVFLTRSLVFPILLFSSVSLHCSLKKALSLLPILWNSAFSWVYLSLSPLPFASLLYLAICKVSESHFAFLHLSCWDIFWLLPPVKCYQPLSIILQALCLLDLTPPSIRHCEILEWVAIFFSRGPRFIRTLHYDLSNFSGPGTAWLVASLSYIHPFTTRLWSMKEELVENEINNLFLLWKSGIESVGHSVVQWTIPLSMGFSRPEYWSGQPFPPPWDFPDPGIKPGFQTLQAESLLSEPPLAWHPGMLGCDTRQDLPFTLILRVKQCLLQYVCALFHLFSQIMWLF